MADLSLKYLLFGEDRTASKAIKGVADTADDSSKRFSGASRAWQAGAALAGAAVVKFGYDTIQSASDQNEVVSKSSVIFGDNATKILSWASTADKSMGLSKTQALEAASGFGDMFLQLGFAGDQAASMSQQVVGLSADLGSFNNLPTAEVADMMSAAFRGEYDSLQRLVPNINAARVETQALAMTGKRNASELTAQEKAAATLAIVTGDAKRAQGDFARTADGAANKQKILTAEFANQQAEIGQKLLPAWSGLLTIASNGIGVFGQVVDVVSGMPGPLLAGATAFGVWALAGDRITGVAGRVTGAARPMGDSLRLAGMYARDAGGGFAGLRAGLSAMTGGLSAGQAAAGGLKAVGGGLMGMLGGPWGIALTGATIAVTAFMQAQANAKADVDELTKTLDAQTGAASELTDKFVADNFRFNVSPEDIASLEAAGVNVRELVQATVEGGPAFDKARNQLYELAISSSDAGGAASGLMSAADNMRGKIGDANAQIAVQKKLLGDTATKTDTAAVKSDIFAGALDGVATAAGAAKVDIGDVNKAIAEFYGRNIDAAEAAIAYEDAVDAATASIKENGRTLDINSAKGRANKSALLDIAKAAAAQSQATITSTGNVGKAGAQMDTARAKFIKLAMQMNGGNRQAAETMATKFGLTKEAVRAMNGEINKTPAAKSTKVSVPTATPTAQARGIRAEIALIRGKNVPVRITTFGLGPLRAASSLLAGIGGIARSVSVGGNARGTASWRGGLTWVGEEGPELVKLPGGTAIYDANRSAAIASSGGGGSGGGDLHLTVNMLAPDGRVLQKQLLTLKRQTGAPLGLG